MGTWVQLGVVSSHRRGAWPMEEQERREEGVLVDYVGWQGREGWREEGRLIQSGLNQVITRKRQVVSWQRAVREPECRFQLVKAI